MDLLIQGLEKLGIVLTDDRKKTFETYLNKIKDVPHNLTAIRDPQGIVVQHFLDSLVVVKYFNLDFAKSFCDIGSGAGLPLLPFKILHPEMAATFIDSKQKSVDFINDVIRTLGLENCSAINGHTTQMRVKPQFDYVLSRALGNATYIMENCLPFLKKGGELFMYKGPKVDEEMKTVPKRFLEKIDPPEVREVEVPFLDKKRFIVRIKKA